MDSTPELISPDDYNAKMCECHAALSWLISKNSKLKSTFTVFDVDHTSSIEFIRPRVVRYLVKALLYTDLVKLLFNKDISSHVELLATLKSSKLTPVSDSGHPIVADMLSCFNPMQLPAHLALQKTLADVYVKRQLSINSIVASIRSFASYDYKSELPTSVEKALLLWISKCCSQVQTHLNSQHNINNNKCIPIPNDLHSDLSDGCCLAVVISYYCPRHISLNDIEISTQLNIADSLHNLTIVCEFIRCQLDLTYISVNDWFHASHRLRPYFVTMIASLYEAFEGDDRLTIVERAYGLNINKSSDTLDCLMKKNSDIVSSSTLKSFGHHVVDKPLNLPPSKETLLPRRQEINSTTTATTLSTDPSGPRHDPSHPDPLNLGSGGPAKGLPLGQHHQQHREGGPDSPTQHRRGPHHHHQQRLGSRNTQTPVDHHPGATATTTTSSSSFLDRVEIHDDDDEIEDDDDDPFGQGGLSSDGEIDAAIATAENPNTSYTITSPAGCPTPSPAPSPVHITNWAREARIENENRLNASVHSNHSKNNGKVDFNSKEYKDCGRMLAAKRRSIELKRKTNDRSAYMQYKALLDQAMHKLIPSNEMPSIEDEEAEEPELEGLIHSMELNCPPPTEPTPPSALRQPPRSPPSLRNHRPQITSTPAKQVAPSSPPHLAPGSAPNLHRPTASAAELIPEPQYHNTPHSRQYINMEDDDLMHASPPENYSPGQTVSGVHMSHYPSPRTTPITGTASAPFSTDAFKHTSSPAALRHPPSTTAATTTREPLQRVGIASPLASTAHPAPSQRLFLPPTSECSRSRHLTNTLSSSQGAHNEENHVADSNRRKQSRSIHSSHSSTKSNGSDVPSNHPNDHPNNHPNNHPSNHSFGLPSNAPSTPPTTYFPTYTTGTAPSQATPPSTPPPASTAGHPSYAYSPEGHDPVSRIPDPRAVRPSQQQQQQLQHAFTSPSSTHHHNEIQYPDTNDPEIVPKLSPSIGFTISAEGPHDGMTSRRNKIMDLQTKRKQDIDNRLANIKNDTVKNRELSRQKKMEHTEKKAADKERRQKIFNNYIRKKDNSGVTTPPNITSRSPSSLLLNRNAKSPSNNENESGDYRRIKSALPMKTNLFPEDAPDSVSLQTSTIARAETARADSRDIKPSTSQEFKMSLSARSNVPSLTSHTSQATRLYVKPSCKSNRHIIINAVTHRCLAGAVHKQTMQNVVKIITENYANHFIVMFRDRNMQYRALYSYNPKSEGDCEAIKIHGVGPKQITEKNVEYFYKYNCGSKNFSEISSTKHLSATVDAISLYASLWSKRAPSKAKPQETMY